MHLQNYLCVGKRHDGYLTVCSNRYLRSMIMTCAWTTSCAELRRWLVAAGAARESASGRENATGHGTPGETGRESVGERGTARGTDSETARGRRRGAATADRTEICKTFFSSFFCFLFFSHPSMETQIKPSCRLNCFNYCHHGFSIRSGLELGKICVQHSPFVFL